MYGPARPTVLVPAPYLHWLSVSHNALAAALAERGTRTIIAPPPSAITNNKSINENQPHPLLENSARYILAIRNESCNLEGICDLTEQTAEIHRQLAAKYEYYRAHLEATPTDLVLLVQGIEPNNAALRAAAIDLGRSLLAIENTAWQRRMIWENIGGTPTIQSLAHNFYARFKGQFSKARLQQFAQHYFTDTLTHKSPEHRTPTQTLPPLCGKPVVLFLGQVLTDSALVFGRNIWKSPLDMMLEIALWCAEHDYQLVIKLHPKEHLGNDPIFNQPYNRLTYRKMCESKRLNATLSTCNAIVDSENIYDTMALITSASIVATMNSQAGLEAAMLGKPVVTGRNAFYANLGFTLDGSSPGALRSSLQQAPSWQPYASAVEFAYIFFEHYCVDRSVNGAASLILRQLSVE